MKKASKKGKKAKGKKARRAKAPTAVVAGRVSHSDYRDLKISIPPGAHKKFNLLAHDAGKSASLQFSEMVDAALAELLGMKVPVTKATVVEAEREAREKAGK